MSPTAETLLWTASLILAAIGMGWVMMEFSLLRREMMRVEAERRSLDYQLMRACTKFEAERQDLQQALLRSRAKRVDLATEVARFKAALVEALDLLVAYRQFGGSDPEATLARLRDDVSQFGHLLDDPE